MSITKEQFNQLKLGDKIVYNACMDSCPTDAITPHHLQDAEICYIQNINVIIAFEKNEYALPLSALNQGESNNIAKYFAKSNNEIDEIYSFWYISEHEIHSIKLTELVNHSGMTCLKCKEYNQYASPNCKDNSFMCYSCRSSNVNKFEELKI